MATEFTHGDGASGCAGGAPKDVLGGNVVLDEEVIPVGGDGRGPSGDGGPAAGLVQVGDKDSLAERAAAAGGRVESGHVAAD